jgi:hypothetical protein
VVGDGVEFKMSKLQIGILWGVAVLVVVVFAILSQVISRSPVVVAEATSTPARMHQLPSIGETARNFYPRADQAARSWHEDARLVSATASWPFVEQGDLGKGTDWTYQFYSPSLQELYVVNVSADEVTQIVVTLSPYVLSTIDAAEWHVDSPEALGIWLDHGGATFLDKHSVVDVSARFRLSEEGQPEWSLVGVVRDTRTFHLVEIDGVSGQVQP